LQRLQKAFFLEKKVGDGLAGCQVLFKTMSDGFKVEVALCLLILFVLQSSFLARGVAFTYNHI